MVRTVERSFQRRGFLRSRAANGWAVEIDNAFNHSQPISAKEPL